MHLAYNVFEDTGSTRVPLMLRDPPRDSNTVCFSWRDPLDPRSRDPNDPLFICNEEMNNFSFFLYDKPNPAVAKCGKNTPANRCDKIENKVVANRPAVEDTYREGWSVVADYDLTPGLVLRYSYGTTRLDEWSSHDSDRTDRLPGEDSVPQDCLDSRSLEECHKAAVTLAHDLDVVGVDGQVQLLGTWSYTGDRYALVQNAESNRMPAYDRLDLRAAWTSVNEQWSATLYVQNALDEIGFVEYVPGFRPDWAFNAQEGYAQGVLTEPREVGLQVRWRPQL